MTATASVQANNKVGYWLGSMGYVDKLDGFTPTPGYEIVLSSKGKKHVVFSNENGDFVFLELPTGEYCVASVRNSDGKTFQIDGNQSKCFEIKNRRTTRFDIVIVLE